MKPVEVVDEAIEEHRAFLSKYVAAGIFLYAGGKVPRTGGVIVVRDMPREELDTIVAQAPFVRRGSARCTVTEFKPLYKAAGQA